eukprot:EG_transcript_7717
MSMFSWPALVFALVCLVGICGASFLTIAPSVIDKGVRPAYWNVTVYDVEPVAPSTFNLVYWSTMKPLFIHNPPDTPDISMAGCKATLSSAFSTTMMFSLDSKCGLGGTFSFLVPAAYLAANPTGNASVLFTVGSNSLRTVIAYTPDSPSPSPVYKPKSPSPSPRVPAILSVVPDTTESGVQPSTWTVTVSDIDPVAPRALQSIYLATCCLTTTFLPTSIAKPVGLVGGCSANATATSRTMLIYLPDDCALGSTFSFIVPVTFLAGNPTGNVSVHFSFGSNSLDTMLSFSGSTAPSTPNPSPSSSPSPKSHSPAQGSPSPRPIDPSSPSPLPAPTKEDDEESDSPTLLLTLLIGGLALALLATVAYCCVRQQRPVWLKRHRLPAMRLRDEMAEI